MIFYEHKKGLEAFMPMSDKSSNIPQRRALGIMLPSRDHTIFVGSSPYGIDQKKTTISPLSFLLSLSALNSSFSSSAFSRPNPSSPLSR